MNRYRFAVRGERVFVLSFMVQSVAQIVMCDSIVRREFNRLLEIGEGFLIFALGFQGPYPGYGQPLRSPARSPQLYGTPRPLRYRPSW